MTGNYTLERSQNSGKELEIPLNLHFFTREHISNVYFFSNTSIPINIPINNHKHLQVHRFVSMWMFKSSGNHANMNNNNNNNKNINLHLVPKLIQGHMNVFSIQLGWQLTMGTTKGGTTYPPPTILLSSFGSFNFQHFEPKNISTYHQSPVISFNSNLIWYLQPYKKAMNI